MLKQIIFRQLISIEIIGCYLSLTYLLLYSFEAKYFLWNAIHFFDIIIHFCCGHDNTLSECSLNR